MGFTEFGDVTLNCPKAKTSAILHYKALPPEQNQGLSSLQLVQVCGVDGAERKEVVLSKNRDLLFQISSMQSLTEEEVGSQSLSQIPQGPYRDLLAKYPKLLEQNFKSEDPKNGIIHRIRTGTHPPTRAKARKLLPGSPKAEGAWKAWKELWDLGIVEPVDPNEPNTWSSPLHLAPKPGGGLRPVGDYRDLNTKTELDQYPLPDLRGHTHHMAGSKIFSKVDMRKAFHQILIHKDDRKKTCVATPWGLFNFRRLSMGLSNSAQSFQRLIDSVLRGVSNCFVYLDDILVYNADEDSHMKTLEEIFARLEKNGLTLALDKCEFGKESLDYLGYTVNAEGILPIKKKVTAIENFPVPIKQKQLLAFLGSLNFYRASLPKTEPSEEYPQPRAPAEVLDPLYKLATAKITNSSFKKEWDSNKKFQSAFDTAKKLLVNAVMINHPVPSAPLALTTDASNYCLGAALD